MDADFFNKTRLSDFYMSETRPRRDLTQNSGRNQKSWCLFLRDRDENKLLRKKKTVNLARFCLKNTHPDQDETETRLSKIEANKTRPRRDCPKKFHLRRDRDEKQAQV